MPRRSSADFGGQGKEVDERLCGIGLAREDEVGCFHDGAVTSVTFQRRNGATRVTVHELYPSKDALDGALASGSTSRWGEQFEQLDDPIVIRKNGV